MGQTSQRNAQIDVCLFLKFNWYGYTLAVKDGLKLSDKIIYLILDIQGEVRKVKLFAHLRLMNIRVEYRQET